LKTGRLLYTQGVLGSIFVGDNAGIVAQRAIGGRFNGGFIAGDRLATNSTHGIGYMHHHFTSYKILLTMLKWFKYA
jgi:hypothetical protein